MINVIFKNGGYCKWNIGEKMNHGGEAILLIADGQELELIRKNFANIPMCESSTISWAGDFAAFIFDNIARVSTIRTDD